ncbi:MAG TPA: hypothetical protein VFI41_07430 [Gemmatimonadales bacterium]|nr:hypothetical protein [Gemmatimonadales bacterium]
MRVKAKICGLHRAEDARHAVEAGADFLGVVLDHGPRQASDSEIRGVVAAAAGLPVLAVVVHSSLAEVLRRRDRTGFAGVQLHGDQDDDEAAAFRREGLVVWRTARLAAESDTPDPAGLAAHADAVLVEPWVAHAAGGGGRALDVARAARMRERLGACAMVLAGGLTAASVGAAASSVQPYAVDVSSGVERAPGIKDPALVARFLEALRGIDSDG